MQGLLYEQNICRYWPLHFGPLSCNFIDTRQCTNVQPCNIQDHSMMLSACYGPLPSSPHIWVKLSVTIIIYPLAYMHGLFYEQNICRY